MQALTRFVFRHMALVAISWLVIAVDGALDEAASAAVTARGQRSARRGGR